MFVKIYNFWDYLDNDVKKKELVNKFYNITSFLVDFYPHYDKWFLKHIDECSSKCRNILFTMDNDKITGIIYLKRDDLERKVCSLYVLPDYRNKGIATFLLKNSFEFLGTTKPCFTVNKSICYMFDGIIRKYDWVKSKEVSDYYKEGDTEVFFNVVK